MEKSNEHKVCHYILVKVSQCHVFGRTLKSIKWHKFPLSCVSRIGRTATKRPETHQGCFGNARMLLCHGVPANKHSWMRRNTSHKNVQKRRQREKCPGEGFRESKTMSVSIPQGSITAVGPEVWGQMVSDKVSIQLHHTVRRHRGHLAPGTRFDTRETRCGIHDSQ